MLIEVQYNSQFLKNRLFCFFWVTDYAPPNCCSPSDFHTFRHPCYLVSKVDVRQDLHSICDRFTSFLKKSVNVNSFILENNLELVMFRVWNYYAMQMSTNIFMLQIFFLYWFNQEFIR